MLTKGKKFLALFLVFSLLSLSGSLPAQTSFRGKPAPECKRFWITEFGCAFDLSKNLRWIQTSLDIGHMFNLNKRSAVGATLFFSLEDYIGRIGIKPRYRHWLNSNFSLEISPGLYLRKEGLEARFPEFVGHVGLNYKDLVILYGQLERVKRSDGYYRQNNLDFSLGIKFGSYAGIAATGTALLAISVLIIVLAAAGDWD